MPFFLVCSNLHSPEILEETQLAGFSYLAS